MFNLSEITTLLTLVRDAERACQRLSSRSGGRGWAKKLSEFESIEDKLNSMLTPIYARLDSQHNSSFEAQGILAGRKD